MAENSTSVAQQTKPLKAASVATAIRKQLGELWLPLLYDSHIKSKRTRAVSLPVPSRLNETEIQHTLLGIELRVGRQRINCPDLATARYLSVFARIGVKSVAAPYDITQVSHFADELESAWQRMVLLMGEAANASSTGFAARLKTLLTQQVRLEIEALGAGPAIPEFNQNTRQRSF